MSPYFPTDYDTISQWHLSFAALSDKGVDTIRSEIIDNNETDFITWNVRDISWSDIPAKIHRDSNGYGFAYFYVQAMGKNGTLYNDFMPVRITPEGDDFSVGIHRNHRKVSVPGRLHIRNEKEIMYVDPLGRSCPLNSINKRAFTIHKKSEGAKTGVLRIY